MRHKRQDSRTCVCSSSWLAACSSSSKPPGHSCEPAACRTDATAAHVRFRPFPSPFRPPLERLGNQGAHVFEGLGDFHRRSRTTYVRNSAVLSIKLSSSCGRSLTDESPRSVCACPAAQTRTAPRADWGVAPHRRSHYNLPLMASAARASRFVRFANSQWPPPPPLPADRA